MKPKEHVVSHPVATITLLLTVWSVIPLFIASNWGYISSHQNSTASADGEGFALGMLFFCLIMAQTAIGLMVFLWYSLKLFDIKRLQARPSNYKLVWIVWIIAGWLALSIFTWPILGSIL